MKITVQTLDKKVDDIVIDDNALVEDLKKQISSVKNCQPDNLKLIFNGGILDDDKKKIVDYNVKDGTKIVMMIQKPKGPLKPPPTPVQTSQPPQNPVPVTQSTNVSSPAPSGTSNNQSSVGVSNLQPVLLTGSANANTSNTNPPNPMINLFTNVLQQNPEMFMQMMLQNPTINELNQQNPQMLQQLITDPNFINQVVQLGQTAYGNVDGDGIDDFMDVDDQEELYQNMFGAQVEIPLTAQQKQEVAEIVQLGFGSYEDAIQYYVAYDHNKELAINALLNDKLDEQQNQ